MNSVKKTSENFVIRFLERRYPGVREVINLMDAIKERLALQQVEGLQNDDVDGAAETKEKIPYIDGGEEEKSNTNELVEDGTEEIANTDTKEVPQRKESMFKEDDGKWRPMVATLALIYKLQKVTDDEWYDTRFVNVDIIDIV